MLAVLLEVGLDRVVAIAPWLIVGFGFGLLAAILGGPLGGLVAAAANVAANALLIPAWVPGSGEIAGVGWQIDLVAAVAALAIGLWIRRLILQPRSEVATAPGGARPDGPDGAMAIADRGLVGAGGTGRSIGDPAITLHGEGPAAGAHGVGGGGTLRSLAAAGTEPAASRVPDHPRPTPPATIARSDVELVANAVRDLAVSRTPAQVADAVARHATTLCGASGAIVYLARDDVDGDLALGRYGAIDPSTPDRLPTGRGPRRTPAAEWASSASAARPAAGDPATAVGVHPIVSGSTTFGALHLVGAPEPLPARCAALLGVLVQVAADALERGRLLTTRRAAETAAAGAVGRVATLARLAAELVGAITLEDIARTLVDLAVDDLAAGFAVLHVPDPASGAFTLIHGRGYPAGLLAADRIVAPESLTPVTRAAADRAIVDIVGEDGWRTAFPTASNVPAITGVRAISAIPMQVGDAVHGVLTIGWRTTADRGRADRDVLATAADQGAQALERALLHAHDQDARRFQEAFIGVVSHELRTPITTILAGSRLLRRRIDGDARAVELSDDIEAEADRLTRIVDDLLVLSRLERRHLTIGDEPVHLDHLLRRVVASEAGRWPEHRIAVEGRRGSHVVIGDETYVEQIVRNLVSNAAKYSPAGSQVEVAIDDAADGDVHVRVLDEGPGVLPAEVDDLFSLFYRSPTTAASAAGAGIGLFVSRRLVAEMGGRMWAAPRPTGGSEFGFSLSRYPIDEADTDDLPSASPDGTAVAAQPDLPVSPDDTAIDPRPGAPPDETAVAAQPGSSVTAD